MINKVYTITKGLNKYSKHHPICKTMYIQKGFYKYSTSTLVYTKFPK